MFSKFLCKVVFINVHKLIDEILPENDDKVHGNEVEKEWNQSDADDFGSVKAPHHVDEYSEALLLE